MRIISQKDLVREQKTKVSWLSKAGLVTSLCAFGIVTAFGIAPDTATESLVIKSVVTDLALPEFPTESQNSQPYSYQSKVERGDSVGKLLSRLKIDDPEAIDFLKSDSIARSIFQLLPGKTVQATTNENGELISLRYYNQADSMLVVEREENRFIASNQSLSEKPQIMFKTGVIRNSVFGATDAAGVPDSIASQLSKIFSTDVDFHSDLRVGDQFTVIYEVFQDGDQPKRVGKLLAAEFINKGVPYGAVYFESSPGRGEYYTPEGKSRRKAFLRSPLEFSRVTSGFTMARFHPILKNWRAHKGVDFAAPTGTKVLSTADAVVEFAGQRNGYGNVVELKHQSQYTTLYAHLSGFAKGLKRGMTIRQGEVIGYVGATGFATGPHLHYEFKVAGIHKDPMGVSVPVDLPVTGNNLAAFKKSAAPLGKDLALLRSVKPAKFE